MSAEATKKATEVAFESRFLALAIGRRVDRLPSTSRRSRRRQRLVIRHRDIVGPRTTTRTDFLKNTTTVAGITTGLHAFGHNLSSYKKGN